MTTPDTQTKFMEQLTKPESALRKFFTLSLDLWCIQGEDGVFKQLSPAWEKVLGWTHAELYQQPWLEFVHPDDIEATQSAIGQCSEQDVVEYENRYRHKNGSYRWLSWRISPDESGFFYGVAKDITATKQLEELAVVMQTASTMPYLTRSPARVEIKQENCQEGVAQSALQAVSELETRVEALAQELQQVNQQLSAEITKHQRTKAAYKKSKEQVRRVFDEAPIGVALEAWDEQIIRVNRAWCEMLGYTKSELLSLTCAKITHPEDWEHELPYVEQLKKGEIESFQLEKRFLKKNREILWVYITTMLLKDTAGEIRYILSMIEDITQHKQTLEALRQSEARYRAIVENQTELICRFKPNGRITFVNDAYCRYFNMSRESLIGYEFLPAMPSEDRQLITKNFRSLSLEHPTNTYEHRIFLPNGEIRWQQWSDRALFDEKGSFIECQAVGRDITPLKHAEAEIRNALEKERELNELRSGFVSLVSHEFRTPLTTIQSSAELLERYGDRYSNEKKQIHFRRIQTAVSRMTNLLDDVLTIGKAEAGQLKFEPSPMDVEAFCSNMVESMQIIAHPQHTINFVVQGECTDAQMDEKLLEHIMTNLLSNAMKYSPQGGIVKFNLICHAESVVFRIQDSGIGIPEKDLEKLFDSFRRASNVGTIPGTGLGLAIVQKCVELHGGQIRVESELGVGTTFIVTLPLKRCIEKN